jgi:hypothetical protein
MHIQFNRKGGEKKKRFFFEGMKNRGNAGQLLRTCHLLISVTTKH